MDYGWTNDALLAKTRAGEVIADTGQLSSVNVRALNREVRAGRLAKWRGRWFPTPGAPWGIGPLKTCYGLPESRELFASFKLAGQGEQSYVRMP